MPRKRVSKRMPEKRLYSERESPFRNIKFVPGVSRVLTREEAIAQIVHDWAGKYGTTEEQAAEELDEGYAHDYTELSEENYKKYATFLAKRARSVKKAASVKTGGKKGTRRNRK